MADEEATTPTRQMPLHRRLPFPLTLEVNNLLPLESTPQRWSRHEHSISLVHYVRLEIIVNQKCVLYDCRSQLRTTHPCWQHLNESIPIHDLSTDDYETMTARLYIESESSSSSSSLFLQLPIHPSKLSRISSLPDNVLPLNAVIITFSDESIRVPPALYNVLVERRLVGTEALDERVNEFGRFRDDAFVALDQVTRERSMHSLLETDDPALASPVRTSLLTPTLSYDSADGGAHVEVNGYSRQLPPPPPLVFDEPVSEGDCYAETQQQLLLERLIEQESVALEQELAMAARENEALLACRQSIEETCQQTQEVIEDLTRLRREVERTYFLLDFQRIRLFRELRIIYPITLIASEQRYKIRDLEVPYEPFTGSVADDECFAALGYLAHLLFLMGKYLSVHFRYRIFYQASRSAMQDDRGLVFPLFMGRNIERDQFEHGLRLLGRNVDCLIKLRNIRVSPKLHILGKVKRIFESVIDGY